MEALLGSSLLEVFRLFSFVLKSGFPLQPLPFFPFQVKLLVGCFEVIYKAGFGLVKIVFHHSAHPVKLLSLLGVQILFIFLLFGSLSFLFDLLVEPLFLFVFEKLSPWIILYFGIKSYWGLLLRINDILRFHCFERGCDTLWRMFTWFFSWGCFLIK